MIALLKKRSVYNFLTLTFLVLSCAKQSGPKTIKFLSIWPEDRDNSKLIMELTKEFQKKNPKINFEFELVAPDNLRQKVKVLLSSKSLPNAFIYESGKPIIELIDVWALLDIEKTFTDLGIMESLDPERRRKSS